jgi:acyl carrier protein
MGLDSVELVMAFEENFGIEISDAEAESLTTPGQVRDLVLARYAARGIPADPDSIFDKIRTTVVEHLNVRLDQVTPEAHFIEDLGVD